MVSKDAMRERILEAATKRFKHYGYAKTSMAEIAADLQMSPGNLYRYFPGKIDIALAIADHGVDKQMHLLRQAVDTPGLPVVMRLRNFFHTDMVCTYEMIESDPRTFELAQIIKTERPAWVNDRLAQEREVINALLNEGVENGEFDLDDIPMTSEMLQSALMKFRYPQLWSNLKLPALEREFDGVCRLLLVGLAGRKGTARECEFTDADMPIVEKAHKSAKEAHAA
jgi:AcrR family transcriptional regulator